MSIDGKKGRGLIKKINNKAVDQILAETRIYPDTLDRAALLRDLNRAILVQNAQTNFLLTRSIDRKKKNRYEAIKQCALRLRDLLLVPSTDSEFNLLLAQRLGRIHNPESELRLNCPI